MGMLSRMSPARPRVAVAVHPRLFRDALSRVLLAEGLDVVMLPEDAQAPPAAGRHFNLAFVTDELPAGWTADIVVRLPAAEGRQGEGSVTTRAGVRPVEFRGLPEVLAFAHRIQPAGDDLDRG